MGLYRAGSEELPDPLKIMTTSACFHSEGMCPLSQQELRRERRALRGESTGGASRREALPATRDALRVSSQVSVHSSDTSPAGWLVISLNAEMGRTA